MRLSFVSEEVFSMAKFKMRLKLQGLELEVEGERQDIPLVTAAVSRELSSIVEPIDVIAEGKQIGNGSGSSSSIDGDGAGRKTPRRRTVTRATGEAAGHVDFRHDSAKFGVPIQGWSILEKVIWMLWVLQQTGAKEYTAGQIVATFNHHFKAAGKLHPPHVPRELQRAKVDVPTPVGEDKERWYLTVEGERQAQALVAQALGQ